MALALLHYAAFVSLGSSGSGTVTFSPAPSQTNTLFIRTRVGLSTEPVTSITQANVTWTKVGEVNASAGKATGLWKGIPTGVPGATATVNWTAGVAPMGAACFEVSSTLGIQAITFNAGAGGTNATETGPTLSPIKGTSNLMLVSGDIGGAYVSGPTNNNSLDATNWTSLDNNNGGFASLNTASATGTYATTYTYNGSVAYDMFGVIITENYLAMAIDAPTTVDSMLGILKSTSGDTVTVAGGAGACSFSAAQDGKLAKGSFLRLDPGTGVANFYLSTYDPTANTGTLLQGDQVTPCINCATKAFTTGSPLVVRSTVSGDTATVTATIKSGTGALVGTVSQAMVNGLAVFGDMGINLAAGTVAHVVTFSASTGTPVDTASMSVRAAFVVKGDFVKGVYQEKVQGRFISVSVLVPTAAVAGTPLGMEIAVAGAGNTGTDGVQNLAWGMGNDLTTHKATFARYAMFPQLCPGPSENTGKKPFREAIPSLVAFVQAAGYTINTKQLDFYGYSAGSNVAWQVGWLYPRYFRTICVTDGLFPTQASWTLAGSNLMDTVSPAPVDQTACAALYITRMQSSFGLYNNGGDVTPTASDAQNDSSYTIFWPLLTTMGVANSSYNSTATVTPTDRRPQVTWNNPANTFNHNGMDSPPTLQTNTNYWNWLAAQPDGLGVTTLGGGPVVNQMGFKLSLGF